jgi:hypothetical protein
VNTSCLSVDYSANAKDLRGSACFATYQYLAFSLGRSFGKMVQSGADEGSTGFVFATTGAKPFAEDKR